MKSNRSKPDKLWTNNNSESINHVIKQAIKWKPQPLPILIEKLFDVSSVRMSDLRSAPIRHRKLPSMSGISAIHSTSG